MKVIDAHCGAGKTSWIIQEINSHPEKSYIYVVPFLDEVKRLRNNCGRTRFSEPHPNGMRKIDNFNELLAEGTDIAVTHTTFLNATNETLEMIRAGQYTIIIDEALEVVSDFNNIQPVENDCRQKVDSGDIRWLLQNDIIRIGENNLVVWIGGDEQLDFKYSVVQQYANLGRLYCVDGTFLVAIFPPEMFQCAENVYILTYLFDGSLLRYYLDLFQIQFTKNSIMYDGDIYTIAPYDKSLDLSFRQNCKELISICDKAELNCYDKRGALSKSWYDRAKGAKDNRLRTLKNHVTSYFRRYLKDARASEDAIMWTCYGEYKDAIKGHGYTQVRDMTLEERELPQAEREALEKMLSCFVPCNAKSTNNFRKRWALVYAVNMFYNSYIRRFFTHGNAIRALNGQPEINPNEDMFALSCMIQWIFRSRIRDQKPICIYIPSSRMRGLLIDWMNGKI